jgi:uncharacterized protein (TIGR02117 family)
MLTIKMKQPDQPHGRFHQHRTGGPVATKAMGRFLAGILLLLALLDAGCVSPVRGLYPAPPGQTPKTVYVLHRGLHTGIILGTADIPPGLWPEHKAFPHAQYLEVGWGDSQAYRFAWTTHSVLRALFYSQGSVLLIHGFTGPVTDEYAGIAKEIIAVQLSPQGYARLCAYIQNAYALDPQGRSIPLAGESPRENFFLATGHYSLLNNCNNWIARALRTAGCPIAPRRCLLSGVLMSETRRFGRVIWLRGQSGNATAEGLPTRPRSGPFSPYSKPS